MNAGLANESAVSQMEATYYQVQGSVLDLQQQINQVENSLALLLAETPRNYERRTLADQQFPTDFAVGIRRPGDILIARRLRFRDGRRLERQGHGLAASPRGSAARGTALLLRQEVVPPCCAATQGAISHPRQESRRLYSLRLSVLHIVT